MASTHAIYAGSFDPCTNGHVWMVEEILSIPFEEVTVAIGMNPEKRSTFSIEERLRMLRDALPSDPRLKFTSYPYKILARYAREIGATHVIRGVRDIADFSYEKSFKEFNSHAVPGTKTLFLMPPVELSIVSSSLVKGLIGTECWQEDIAPLVPKNVAQRLRWRKGRMWSDWEALWGRLDAKGDPRPVFEALLKRYDEPHRYYHTLAHIEQTLDVINEMAFHLKQSDVDILEMALWYHDAIYAIGDKQNEQNSAMLAKRDLATAQVPESVVAQICGLIGVTCHKVTPVTELEQHMVDIDLSILGTDEEQYQNYVSGIWQEFDLKSFSERRKMRADVLQRFLDRDPLFRTPLMRDRFESRAAANLASEIGHLRSTL